MGGCTSQHEEKFRHDAKQLQKASQVSYQNPSIAQNSFMQSQVQQLPLQPQLPQQFQPQLPQQLPPIPNRSGQSIRQPLPPHLPQPQYPPPQPLSHPPRAMTPSKQVQVQIPPNRPMTPSRPMMNPQRPMTPTSGVGPAQTSYPAPLNVQPPLNSLQPIELVENGDKIRMTRERANKLVMQMESEIMALDQEIMKEKAAGIPDRVKAKFFLNERKAYITNVNSLLERQQTVMKKVNELAQQHQGKNISELLDESNKTLEDIQAGLEQQNWRDIVAEANSREDGFEGLSIPPDPEVEGMLEDLERQANNAKGQRAPPAALLPGTTFAESIPGPIANRPVSPVPQTPPMTAAMGRTDAFQPPRQQYKPASPFDAASIRAPQPPQQGPLPGYQQPGPSQYPPYQQPPAQYQQPPAQYQQPPAQYPQQQQPPQSPAAMQYKGIGLPQMPPVPQVPAAQLPQLHVPQYPEYFAAKQPNSTNY